MIGVTIGVGGKWRELAELAAAAAQQWTGLNIVVLGDDELRHSGISRAVELKTAVFDYVAEENILLFDADLLFVREWDPTIYADRQELICVRDFNFEPHILADALRLGIPARDYFNAGFIIANRTHHSRLFEHARRSLHEVRSPLYDQSALNAGRVRLGIPVQFLDRRYNTLSDADGFVWDFVPPIGAHAAGTDNKGRFAHGVGSDLAAQPAGNVWQIDPVATEGLKGRFFQFSVGDHTPRTLELRDDNTIGLGSMDLERFWYATTDGLETVLRLAHRHAMTGELRESHGGAWAGMQMGVPSPDKLRLVKHPAQVAAEVAQERLPGQLLGAVLGSPEGDAACILLQQCRQLALYIVYPWTLPEDEEKAESLPANGDLPAISAVAEPEKAASRAVQAKANACSLTQFAESRRYIVDLPLCGAAQTVPQESLGLLFITPDGDTPTLHEILTKWYPKVRPGGMVLFQPYGCDPDSAPIPQNGDGLPRIEWHEAGVCSIRKPMATPIDSPELARLPATFPKAKPQAARFPGFVDRNNARATADLFLGQLPPYPQGRFRGRGVVICGGGSRYLTCAWVCINMLRRAGCRLPIELWQTTQFEMDRSLRELFAPLDVTCINAEAMRRQHPVRRLAGWELKPYSIIHSSFQEIISLDADNMPLQDPTFLFESPQYKKSGAIFWPDFGSLEPDREIWKICQVQFHNEPEFESGQIVVDKQRCWRALQLTMHLNEYSDFYYQHVHGDKETFHMAWRMLDQEYAMVPHPILGLPGCMCQHDFHGKRLFQHRNMAKWNLNAPNERIPDFRREEECLALIEELQAKWDGTVGCDWAFNASEEQAAREVLEQRKFQYVRVGHDSRAIEFLPAGKIGEGRAGCEECWFIEQESTGHVVLVLVGRGEHTCRLQRQADGSWRGNWLVFERMPIHLKPIRLNQEAPEQLIAV